MKQITAPVILISACTALVSCGGGSETTSAAASVDTQDIVAPSGFDFRNNKTITLAVQNVPSENGALHVYHKKIEVDGLSEITPDPLTRVTTIKVKQYQEVSLLVNDDWSALYLEWIPMVANGEQKTYEVNLSANESSYLVGL